MLEFVYEDDAIMSELADDGIWQGERDFEGIPFDDDVPGFWDGEDDYDDTDPSGFDVDGNATYYTPNDDDDYPNDDDLECDTYNMQAFETAYDAYFAEGLS